MEPQERSEDESEELQALTALNADAEGYSPDWRHGETLIREDMFEDYARELADDIGALKDTDKWPLNHIDWEAAAKEIMGLKLGSKIKLPYPFEDREGEIIGFRYYTSHNTGITTVVADYLFTKDDGTVGHSFDAVTKILNCQKEKG
jgi:hypothetical protein